MSSKTSIKHDQLQDIASDQHHNKKHDLSSSNDHSGKLDESLIKYNNPPGHEHKSSKIKVKAQTGKVIEKNILEFQASENILSIEISDAGKSLDKTIVAMGIKNATITDAKIATANKDGAATTPSMRTLGTGTLQACAGDDARLSDPAWHGVLHGAHGNSDPIELLRNCDMLAIAGPTPADITVSIARCVQFTPPTDITVNRIRLFGVGITTEEYKFAIYSVGLDNPKLWDSGAVTTAANTWLSISTNLPITLTTGIKYWFCVTAVAQGGTTGFRSPPAPLGTAFWGADATPLGERALSLPVYAQFAVSDSVFPAKLPAIAAAAYAGGTTGSVPFAWLDNVV